MRQTLLQLINQCSSGYDESRRKNPPLYFNQIFILQTGWFAHPIFSRTGGYPPLMIDVVNNNSNAESRTWSRLPEFTADEITYVKGTSDFFGLNYYTSQYATPAKDASTRWPNPSYYKDVNSIVSQNATWPVAKSTWLRSSPDGLRALLK